MLDGLRKITKNLNIAGVQNGFEPNISRIQFRSSTATLTCSLKECDDVCDDITSVRRATKFQMTRDSWLARVRIYVSVRQDLKGRTPACNVELVPGPAITANVFKTRSLAAQIFTRRFRHGRVHHGKGHLRARPSEQATT